MEQITSKQIKKIWATARELDLSEEKLRDLVEEISGARSISNLTKRQAIEVIDRLEARKRYRFRKEGRSYDRKATPWQYKAIRRELTKLSRFLEPDHLQNWCQKYLKRTSFEGLSSKEAQKVLHAMVSFRKRLEIRAPKSYASTN